MIVSFRPTDDPTQACVNVAMILWEHAGSIRRRTGLENPDDLRDLAIGLVARLIFAGLPIPGEFDGAGHRP
jgi:hypothetical protein